MGYLPTSVTNDDISIEETKYKDFYFDEETKEFNGKVVEGIQAIKSWIYFALKIARYRYPIYSFKYGSELETLIGTTYDDDELMQSECKRYIEDALLINPYITEVNDVVVSKINEELSITCTVETKYGEIYVKV